jgi:hypothetical protein
MAGSRQSLPQIPPVETGPENWAFRYPNKTPKRSSARAAIKEAAQTQSERELMVGGEGSAIPIYYGRNKFGIKPAFMEVDSSGNLHIVGVCQEGPIQEIEDVLFDNVASAEVTGVTITKYLGTAAQTYPAALHSAFPAYEDNLPYVAYVYVIISPTSSLTSLPNITVITKGRTPYDPVLDDEAYSVTPSLCFADFLVNDRYGRGISSALIDWDSVDAARDVNDDAVNDLPRNTLNGGLPNLQSVENSITVLQEYAGVFLAWDGGKIYFVPDRPAASELTITGSDIHKGSWQISEKDDSQCPTIVEVYWTDADQDWRRNMNRVTDGSADVRIARYYMDGLNNASEAVRYAYQKLNKGSQSNLLLSATLKDIGAKALPGTRLTLQYDDFGLDSEWRVLTVEHVGNNRWAITAEEYDPDSYSDASAEATDLGDNNAINANNPPTPTGLAVEEVVKLLKSNIYVSSLEIAWDDMWAESPFVGGYEVLVVQSGNTLLRDNKPETATKASTGTVEEGQSCSVSVRVVSTSGAFSAWATTSITPDGTPDVPPNVSNITRAQEIAGWVLIKWVNVPGIRAYHIKRGATSDTWATAETLSDFHAALEYWDKSAAGGSTYRYFVKAVGVTTQPGEVVESATAAYVDVAVSEDNSYQFLGEHTFTEAELTGSKMRVYRKGNKVYAISDAGEGWDFGYTGNYWNSDSLINKPWWYPRSTYGGSDGLNDADVYVITDSFEVGPSVVAAQFSVTGITTNYLEEGDTAGVKYEIGLSDDDSTYVWYNGLNIAGSGRYVKVRISDRCDGVGAALKLELDIHLSVNATVREETDEIEVTGLEAQPITVTLAGVYSGPIAGYPQLTAYDVAGSALAITLAENRTGTSFDLYCLDEAGDPIAATVGYVWKGV